MHEIELKFQVPEARRVALERTIGTRSAETLELTAVYFDTPEAALAAHRLVLRVRREGQRWVQALKGPGDGVLQRLEDEVPLPPSDRPPDPDPARHDGTAAGRLLAAALAGAGPLRPVHGTEIVRLRRRLRHGGARIEAAFDRGRVRAGDAAAPVCELELELLDGPVEALFDLACRWAPRFGLVFDPATKSERAQWLLRGLPVRPVVKGVEPVLPPGLPLSEARAAMLRAVLAHALPNAAAITAGASAPDHVHQLRVALRRLRTVLRALGEPDATRDEALARLFQALGASRDAHVRAGVLAPAWAAARAAGLEPPAEPASPDDPGPRALAESGTTVLWMQVLALTVPGGQAGEPAWDPTVRARLARWHRGARRLAAEWPALDDESRHALRKRLKRLRYLVEFAHALLPRRRLGRELERLRALQEALGRWNDLVVARAHLAPLRDPASCFAAGWLACEALEAERACRSAAAQWRAGRDGLRGRHFDG